MRKSEFKRIGRSPLRGVGLLRYKIAASGDFSVQPDKANAKSFHVRPNPSGIDP